MLITEGLSEMEALFFYFFFNKSIVYYKSSLIFVETNKQTKKVKEL